MENVEKKMTVTEIRKALQADPNFLLLRAVDILAQAEKAEAELKPLAQAKATLEKEIDELKTRAASEEQRLLTAKSKLRGEIDQLEKLKIEVQGGLNGAREIRDELAAAVARSSRELEEIHGVQDLIAETARLTAEIEGKRRQIKVEDENLAKAKKSVRLAEASS